jgi:signal transduction histidine kinase
VTGQLADHADPATPAAQDRRLDDGSFGVARRHHVRRAGPMYAGLWVAGAALTILILVLFAQTGAFNAAPFEIGLLASCSAVVGGLLAWRRPGDQVGPIMALLGLNLLCTFLNLSTADVLFTAGLLMLASFTGLMVHLLLAYPAGQLTRRERHFVLVAGYLVPVTLWLAHALVFDPDRPSPWNWGDVNWGGQRNLLLVADAPGLDDLLQAMFTGWMVVLLAWLIALLVGRWRRASPIARRLVGPVLWVGLVWALHKAWQWLPMLGVKKSLYLAEPGRLNRLGALDDLLGWVEILVLVALLVYAGVFRQRLARSGVADLVLELDAAPVPARLRDALARSLEDPSVQVLYQEQDEQGWVDAAGRPARPPGDSDPSRAVTTVTRGGRVVGAIVHDAALRDQPTLVRAAAATTGLTLENERLGALALARLDEVRGSRARVVAASDAARRRIERNLHDGAQQYLVALYLQLRQLEAHAATAPPERLAAELEAAATAAETLNQELRSLAEGIHPAALSQSGLPGALAALAANAPLPVRVTVVPERRLPEPIEAAAWFVVAELVTNAAKYAHAGTVTVGVWPEANELHVRVADDGVGGATETASGGLEGLRDRVAALAGRLEVHSPPGAGTRVDAWLAVEGDGNGR